MNLLILLLKYLKVSIPRVSGGEPTPSALFALLLWYSPRERG